MNRSRPGRPGRPLLHRPAFLSLAFATAFLVAGAATHPPETYSAREKAQGHRDGVVLAKPRVDRRATADSEEAREGLQLREKFDRLDGLRVIEVAAGDTVEATVARLRKTGRYEFVEPDALMQEDALPNDPNFTSQWALNNTAQFVGAVAGAHIDAVRAWDIVREAPNVIVALIDNGVRIDHQDLAPNLWRNPSPTFGDVNGARIIRGARSGEIGDETGHGSHTAGIVGAQGNNGIATSGVAWRVQLMPLKNAGPDGVSSTSDSAALIDYAVAKGAHIINCSFGGVMFSQAMFSAVRAARDAGVIVVASAGNSALNADTNPHYPSGYMLDNIVTVGSSTMADEASFSTNYGASIDLFAPGQSIYSTDWTGTSGAVYRSGTSMAAPHVTGALVLLKARYPSDNYRQLINRLLRGADLTLALAGHAQTNARLNLYRALQTSTNRPANDDFGTRYLITGTTTALRANNRGATSESGEPRHADQSTSGTLWWQWVAPANATMVIDTAGSAFDTVLAVYTGGSLTTLTPVASNDNDAGKETSRVSFTAASGSSYFIVLGGRSGAEGYAQLNIAVAPPNDNFANATTLAGESAQASGRNNSGSLEPGEPRILGLAGGASLWYKWTAPRNARFQVSAFSYDFDTLLAVYTGSALDKLTLVTANDDTMSTADIKNVDSRCNLDAVAGTTYYIQADTKATAVRGSVIVTLTDSLWQFSTDGGDITATPAIAPDGSIYVGAISPDRRLYALTPDGSLKWSYSAGGSIDIGSAAIATDGTIYQGSADGKVLALTPAGTVRWTRDLGTGNSTANTPALAADGTIYIHAEDGYLYALAPADGSTRWRYNVNARATFASAVVAPDGTIYQGSDRDNALYALNADGTLKWRYSAPTGANGNFSTPALDAAGNIYFTTYSSARLISVTPDGSQRWVYAGITSSTSGSPSLSADGATVYIGGGDRRLHAVDTTTGAARWTYTAGSSILASTPAIDSNGVIYIGSYDGKLHAVTSGGSLKRTWDTALPVRSSPAIFGTTLYLGGRDAKLYAFDIGASAAAGPWPQYKHNPRNLGRRVTETLAVTAAPQTSNVNPGNRLLLTVSATGQGPLTYQWSRDGAAIAGATGSTYQISRAAIDQSGNYTVKVTGPQGNVTSSGADVVIATAEMMNPGRLINLSIMTQLTSPTDSFTVGAVVGGSGTIGTKPLLVRAVGPSLAAFGLDDFVPDPKLELFRGSTPAGANDNWNGDAAISAAMTRVGAFGLASATSHDAAFFASAFAKGDNSVKITSAPGGSGRVIAEIYDATPSSIFTTVTPRLINVSVLKDIGDGLTAGFVIAGRSSKKVLIRAVGPGLAVFGVEGESDPKLELFSGTRSIAVNNDWNGAGDLAAAFTQVGAFALDPTSKDAAVLATLAPGSYTAQVSGTTGQAGLALIEVYEVP